MNGFENDKIKVFISYSDKDRDLAGRLKTELTNFGINVFLAHDDLAGGQEWEDMIIDYIKRCDIFLTLLTKHFEVSAYCNQEIGIAISHGKKILPIQVDSKPCGFIKRFQATKKLDREDISSFSIEFIRALQIDNNFKEKMLECIVDKFCDSWSFSDASQKLDMLLFYKNLSKEHLNKIAKASLENSQILGCFGAPKKLKTLFSKHDKKLIDPSYIPKLEEKYGVKI